MKTALISGTSSGLGEDIALNLLKQGWSVIGLSRKQNTKLMTYENFHQKIVNIINIDELEKVFDQVDDLDCIINNAAVFKLEDFENTSLNDIQTIINTNLLAPIYITKLSLNKLNPNSRIIYINSVAGLYEFSKQSIYCSSKHGLKAFSSIISKELKSKKIKTISLHPGGINTPLWNNTPYPLGDVEKALDVKDISKLIMFILNSPEYIEFKSIEIFPEIESH